MDAAEAPGAHTKEAGAQACDAAASGEVDVALDGALREVAAVEEDGEADVDEVARADEFAAAGADVFVLDAVGALEHRVRVV